MPRLFKEKFLIALYDPEELCVGVFDNCAQMAQKMGKSIDLVQSLIGHFNRGDFKTIDFLGIPVTVHLIPNEEKENGINN